MGRQVGGGRERARVVVVPGTVLHGYARERSGQSSDPGACDRFTVFVEHRAVDVNSPAYCCIFRQPQMPCTNDTP